MDNFTELLKANNNVDLGKFLARKTEVGKGVFLTTSERVGVYLASKDVDAKRHLIHGWGQTEANIQSIKEYCDLVRQNLGNLSFPLKRQALEALKIRLISSNDGLKLEGQIPIVLGLSA